MVLKYTCTLSSRCSTLSLLLSESVCFILDLHDDGIKQHDFMRKGERCNASTSGSSSLAASALI